MKEIHRFLKLKNTSKPMDRHTAYSYNWTTVTHIFCFSQNEIEFLF